MKRLLLLLALGGVAPASGHELKTAALWLDEAEPGRVEVTLRTPLSADGGAAALLPRLDPQCRIAGAVATAREDDAVRRTWTVDCSRPLDGMRVRIDGLDPRMPDAVVIARFADGREATLAVDRHEPELIVAPPAAPVRSLLAYFPLGIEHILFGADHLLFVIGVMLAVLAGGGGARRLVWALTAFTLAHSLTLALAALGIWGLPPKVVELLIALSIVTLALELARAGPGVTRSLALRRPAVVAFVFGLLHGFGFAGALREIGLPEGARAWALLLFNAGVEAGQLLFVGAVLLLAMLARHWKRELASVAPHFATLLGGVATYWTFERALDWSATLLPRI